ncbi:MAG: hypothetical protein R2857_15455 [Vampirovibrionales bacterium]
MAQLTHPAKWVALAHFFQAQGLVKEVVYMLVGLQEAFCQPGELSA